MAESVSDRGLVHEVNKGGGLEEGCTSDRGSILASADSAQNTAKPMEKRYFCPRIWAHFGASFGVRGGSRNGAQNGLQNGLQKAFQMSENMQIIRENKRFFVNCLMLKATFSLF